MSSSKEAIYRLMNAYCFCIDQGDLEGFAALFENASFGVIGDEGGPSVGKAAVLEFLQNVILYDGKPQTKHVMSNVQIDHDDDSGQASAQCYIIVFQALEDFPMQAIFGGHYHDRFVKTGESWEFVSRDISPDLVGDLSRHRSDLA
jgi:hypothetical protein